MRIKIISKGSPHNTQVVNADTGESIEGIQSINIICSLKELTVAKIIIIDPKLDIVAEGTIENVKYKN